MDSQEHCRNLLSLQNIYDPICISMEKGQIEKLLVLSYVSVCWKQGTSLTSCVAPSTDKLTRARSIQARMRAGLVKFDKQADWYLELEEEATIFPRGKHDDQVDALAYWLDP
jgi:predicted phage terminase large subunit-like protein